MIVTKFVSMPPSQRWLTYGWPARSASWEIGSWACFLVPTKRTDSPRAVVSRTASRATSSRCDGLGEVDDVDPVALREDERAHLGIPAARLVAEVDAGLEQLPHGDGGHAWSSCSVATSAGPVPDRVARASRSAPRHRPGSVAAPRVGSSPRRGDGGWRNGPTARRSLPQGPPASGLPHPAVVTGPQAARRARARRRRRRGAGAAPGGASRRAGSRRSRARRRRREDERSCGRPRSPRAARRRATVASGPRRPRAPGVARGRRPRGPAPGVPTRTRRARIRQPCAARAPRRRPPRRRRRAGPASAGAGLAGARHRPMLAAGAHPRLRRGSRAAHPRSLPA